MNYLIKVVIVIVPAREQLYHFDINEIIKVTILLFEEQQSNPIY